MGKSSSAQPLPRTSLAERKRALMPSSESQTEARATAETSPMSVQWARRR